MKWFPAEQQMTINNELAILGFSEPDKILATAEVANDPLDPSAKAVICDEIRICDHFTADIYFLIRERIDGVWYIDGLMAWVQMETIRNEEGILLVQKAYSISIEPLPSARQIKTDIEDLVRYEEYVEFFLVNNNLEEEFRKLGFEDFKKILPTARYFDNVTYLAASEPILIEDAAVPERIEFQFLTLSDIVKRTVEVTLIRAYLATTGDVAEKVKEDTETIFFAMNGQLPGKNQMIYQILAHAGEDNGRYEAIKKQLQPDDSALNVKIQAYHKGRLHF
jgi:hypothetical protein